MKSEFDTPGLVPLFPLTGSLLLPGTLLPLNVFEPRYVRLVADCLAGDRVFGMVQPRRPDLDNFGPVDDPDDPPSLQAVGCLGGIDRAERQGDGRYQIVLRGVSRFRIVAEEPPLRGYRRASVSYAEFSVDAEEPEQQRNAAPVLAALARFSERHDLEFDLETLRALSGVVLVNALSSALPFSPLEKQGLLEAPDVAERERVLLALMGMGVDERPDVESYYSPPTVH